MADRGLVAETRGGVTWTTRLREDAAWHGLPASQENPRYPPRPGSRSRITTNPEFYRMG